MPGIQPFLRLNKGHSSQPSWNAGELPKREKSGLFVDLETQDIANGTTGSTLKRGNDQTQVAYG